MLKPAFTIILLALFARPSSSQDLWDMTQVRDFYFTFTQPNWWTQLQNSQSTGVDIPADLVVDATLTRETISYRVLRDFIAAPRTAYFRSHMNGTYWGIYIPSARSATDRCVSLLRVVGPARNCGVRRLTPTSAMR